MGSFRQALRQLLRSIAANEASSLQRWPAPGQNSRKEVGERAIQLLTRNLSAAQRTQYETGGYFDVTGGDTGTRYGIRHGCQMNVEELDHRGRRHRMWCFMPEGHLPVGDIMLAQKIALELYESDALRITNRSPPWDEMFADELRFARRFARR
jgi:hypothetical protein